MKTSDLARPPIQPHETEHAETALCNFHNGNARAPWAREGQVFYCPIGRQFWRWSATPGHGMYSPIRYPKSGVI